MALRPDTIRQARHIRVLIDTVVDGTVADLVQAWGSAWDAVADEWRAAVAELQTLTVDGRWPARATILRSMRVQRAMQITAAKLDELSAAAGVRIVQDLPDLIGAQELALFDVLASQLPTDFVADWSRVSDKQLDAIVKRATTQVTSTLRPLPRDVTAGMKQELIRGVALGTNPEQVAAIMIDRFGARFNGGLARAKTIARTEMLDATRNASLASRKENSKLVGSWRWLCTLSARTCPACLAMNGREFPADEPGPHDHQCGRCTAVPVVRSWRELGIVADEPAHEFPDARTWFGQQTPAVQAQIMGPDRLAALNSGRVGWDQIPVRRSNPGWRDSWGTAAVGRRAA